MGDATRLTLAIANQKGGTAKTNVAGNVAAELAAAGLRVVVIDLDPQATLSTWMVGRRAAVGTAEVLLGDSPLAPALLDVPDFGVRLLASVPDRMRVTERTLAAQVGGERALARAIRELDTDVIIVDCPPSMGILTAAALVAATAVVVPVAAAPEALDGLVQFLGNLQRLRDALELELPLLGVVPTRYDGRLRIAREALDAMKAIADGAVTATVVRENVSLRELFGHRRPIRTYAAGSMGAADYAALAQEIRDRAKV